MDQQMTPDQKIEAMGNVLDQLADVQNGRRKCGLIWVMSDLLNSLSVNIAEMEAKIDLFELEKTEKDKKKSDK